MLGFFFLPSAKHLRTSGGALRPPTTRSPCRSRLRHRGLGLRHIDGRLGLDGRPGHDGLAVGCGIGACFAGCHGLDLRHRGRGDRGLRIGSTADLARRGHPPSASPGERSPASVFAGVGVTVATAGRSSPELGRRLGHRPDLRRGATLVGSALVGSALAAIVVGSTLARPSPSRRPPSRGDRDRRLARRRDLARATSVASSEASRDRCP